MATVGYLEDYNYKDLNDNVILIWDLIASSEDYDEYPVCANGTEYIATDTGYVVVYCEDSKINSNFSIRSQQDYSNSSNAETDNSDVSVFIPVVKGYTFKVYYNKSKPTWIRLFKAEAFQKDNLD